MSEDEQIIHSVLENFTCSDPADPNDPTAWHFTDKEVRSMLGICIETVRERMMDPVEGGRKIAALDLALAEETTRRLMVQDAATEYQEAWQDALSRLEEARATIAVVLQELPEAGKDNDDVYAVWNTLYKKCHWLHPEKDSDVDPA